MNDIMMLPIEPPAPPAAYFEKIPLWSDGSTAKCFEIMADELSGRIPVTRLDSWRDFTNLLESDLRSYADLGDDWDDLPDTQGEIKLWIPEDLGQPKEISISKESL